MSVFPQASLHPSSGKAHMGIPMGSSLSLHPLLTWALGVDHEWPKLVSIATIIGSEMSMSANLSQWGSGPVVLKSLGRVGTWVGISAGAVAATLQPWGEAAELWGQRAPHQAVWRVAEMREGQRLASNNLALVLYQVVTPQLPLDNYLYW